MHNGPIRRAVGVLCLVVTTTVGCSNSANGNPVPESSTGSGSSTGSVTKAEDAPEVPDPLNVTTYIAAPCETLSSQQLAAFEVFEPGTPTTTGGVAEKVGPFCTWHASEELGSTTGIGFLVANEAGIADFYRTRDDFAYFEPFTVNGYPALYVDRTDMRSSGNCTVVVGISNELTFRVTEQGRMVGDEACQRASDVAAAALTTLQGEQ